LDFTCSCLGTISNGDPKKNISERQIENQRTIVFGLRFQGIKPSIYEFIPEIEVNIDPTDPVLGCQ
jgi:hypothetical protein